VAPAYALWAAYATEAFSPDKKFMTGFWLSGQSIWLIGAAAILLCIGSAWRLAKFNVDTRQTHGFLGLATPANGLFWVSSILVVANSGIPHFANAQGLQLAFSLVFAQSPIAMLVLAFVLTALMVSELPLPSLKFKQKGWKGNEVIFLLIGIGVLLAVFYGILAVPLILVIYLLSPLWGKAFKKDRSNRNEATAQRERNVDL
jgi:CDP-diacylglycerol--serine O-phosphatidyltransferase